MQHRSILRRIAFGASFVVVAGVAAVNSYDHMRAVALLGHQSQLLASTLPLSVDGLLIIATLAMSEDKANGRRPRGWARFAFWFGAAISVAANIAATAVHYGDPLSIAVSAWPPVALLIAVEIMARPGKPAKAIPVAPASPAISMAELESPDLPEAPVSPSPAAISGKSRGEYGPRKGDQYSERHNRRRRTGK